MYLKNSKPISGRFLAVAEYGRREKPGGVGAVPFGKGVWMSPDIVDNIAEGGVAQGSAVYEVGNVAPQGFAKWSVESGVWRGYAEGFVTESLHQLRRDKFGGKARFSEDNYRAKFDKFIPRHQTAERSDVGERDKQRGAEEVALGRAAPSVSLGEHWQHGVDGRVAA